MTTPEEQQRLCLIGTPIQQSLSPALQNAGCAALGLPLHYELRETAPVDLPAAIAAVRTPAYLGANVTIPHKEAVLPLLDEIAPLAARVGAVNTLVKVGDRLRGENTDVGGFLWPLQQHQAPFDRWQAVLLGAGGAARGVAVALLLAGVQRLTVVNRTLARAAALVDALGDPRATSLDLTAPDLPRLLASTDLLVCSVPPGTDAAAPLTALLAQLPPTALVYDLAYRQTPLLTAAAARGLVTLDGLPMLVEQGALALELWTGRTAPREIMLAAALAGRGA